MDADIDGAGSDGLLLVPKAYCCLTFNLLLLSVTYWLTGRPCRDIRVFESQALSALAYHHRQESDRSDRIIESNRRRVSEKPDISSSCAKFCSSDNWQRFCLKALLRLDITLLRGRVISGRDPSRKGDAKGFQ